MAYSDITAIESAFDTYIWAHSSIVALGGSVFKYEATQVSEKEAGRLYDSTTKKLNFWECIVTQDVGSRLIGSDNQAALIFPVQIRYTREKDVSGEAHRKIKEGITTLLTLVETELGDSWQSTVDWFTHQTSQFTVEEAVVAGRDVWRGVYQFNGNRFKAI